MASNYLQQLRDESRAWFLKLERTQRWLIGGGLALAIALITVMAIWSQQTNWSTLYSDVSSKDAGQIVAYLKENNIPYQVQTRGVSAVIQVPASQVHELRLQMAAQDLPREGGVLGFELFDQDKIGMTNRVFDLNYQRALAGELARTIMQMDGVEKARVHLAIPRKQIFTDLQEPTSASVHLQLKPLAELKEGQIKGISKLVAGSVPGLEQKHVTITDGEGKLLYDPSEDDGSQKNALLNQEQLNLQKQVESETRQKVEQILARVVGYEHLSVQVKASLDFDTEESVSKTYRPNDDPQSPENIRALRSEKVTREKGLGTEAQAGGNPGVVSNLPEYKQKNNQNQAAYERQDTTRNFEVPEVQTTRVKDLGQIKKLSLSVAIDSQSPAINSPEGLDSEDPLVVNLRNLAEKAAGLDPKRGDTIAIYAMPFDNSELTRRQEAEARAEQLSFWAEAIKLGVIALVVLFVFGTLLFLWSRRRRKVDAEALENQGFFSDDYRPALEAAQDPEWQEAAIRRATTVRSLADLSKDDPARMARLLRVWMQEN